MMTSGHENAFLITGLSRGEPFKPHPQNLPPNQSNESFMQSMFRLVEQVFEQTVELPINWDVFTPTLRQCSEFSNH